MNHFKTTIIITTMFIILLASCSNSPDEVSVITVVAEAEINTPTHEPTPTLTASPTSSPTPSLTPTHTSTPTISPTSTSTPSPTMTPTPSPTAFGGYAFKVTQEEDKSIVVAYANDETFNLTAKLPYTNTIYYGGDLGSMSPDRNWVIIGNSASSRLVHGHSLPESPPVDLWIMSTDGKTQENILDVTINTFSSGMSWSDDSSRFAFNCPNYGVDPVEFDATHGICLFDLDNFEVTQTEYFGYSPTLSPDGTKIAFLPRLGGPSLWEVGSEELFPIEQPDFSGPTNKIWHPDGTGILGFFNNYVHLLYMDKPGRKFLCELDISPPYDLEQSPDRTRLLIRNYDSNPSFALMDFDCGNLVTNKIPGEWDVIWWTPDSKQLITLDGIIIDPLTGEVMGNLDLDSQNDSDT